MNVMMLELDGVAVRLALALGHFVWQGVLIGAAVLLGNWLLRKRSSQARYAVQVAGLLVMAACLPATFALTEPAGRAPRIAKTQPVAELQRSAGVESRDAAIPATDIQASSIVDAENDRDAANRRTVVMTELPTARERSSATGWDIEALTGMAMRWSPAVSAIYLAGVTLMLLRLAAGLWGVQRLRSAAQPVTDGALLATIRRQARQIGLRATPVALWCSRATAPVVVGILRPAILLPGQLATGLAPEQLAALIAHELAHLRRHDLVVNLLQRMVEAMLFFHPAVWYVSRCISRERERCCDDAVLGMGWPAVKYADALLAMAELCLAGAKGKTPFDATLLAASGDSPSQLKRRVLRILGIPVEPAPRLTPRGLATLVVALVPLLLSPVWFGWLAKAQSPKTENSSAAEVNIVTGKEWSQWGGSGHRNSASPAKGLPSTWVVGSSGPDRAEGAVAFDEKTKNIRWTAKLGTSSYGSPVVAGGKVFVGTNNGAGRITRFPKTKDLSCLMCFDQASGKFLWQYSSPKLAAGRVNDWPEIGLCSTPCVVGDRLWLVTNRCEVVCLDVDGFRDGQNDGPIQDEAAGEDEADVIWRFDMMEKLKVRPLHQACSSPTCYGELLLLNTSNGLDESHAKIPSVEAPSFLALDQRTGHVVWQDASPGANLLGSMCPGTSPAVGVFDGVAQAIFPGGDGWLYSFDLAVMQEGKTKLLWKFDCNPKESVWQLGNGATRNTIVATPTIYENRLYIAVGCTPELGEGPGRVWCIDPTRRGDISAELVYNKAAPDVPIAHKRLQACEREKGDFTRPNANSGVVWQYVGLDANGDGKLAFQETMHRSIGNVSLAEGLAVVADISGILHCLDAKTGQPQWTHDLQSPVWATPLVADGKIYIGDEDGEATVFKLGRKKEVLAEVLFDAPLHSTPAAVDGMMFWSAKTQLVAAGQPASPEKPAGDARRSSSKDPLSSQLGEVRVLATGGELTGVRRITRELLWRKQIAGEFGQPAMHGTHVYCGDNEGKFYCLLAQTGRPVWDFAADDEISASAGFTDGVVFFGTQSGSVYALREETGELVWQAKLGDQVRSTPVAAGKLVLVAACDGKLYFLDRATGKQERFLETGSPTGSTPLIQDGKVFVATEAGDVLSCRIDGGDWLWKQNAGEDQPVRGFGTIEKGMLVVAIDTATGDVLWKTRVSGNVDHPPVIRGQQVIARTSDGKLWALNRGTGKVESTLEAAKLEFHGANNDLNFPIDSEATP